ncbi:MAG: EAL domain-containing protein [Rhodocyclales bacterium]|nr:EAL domain-containing protein [Rhodocyclales bacterium]
MKKRAAPAADSDFLDIIDDRAERGGAPDPGAPTWRLLIVDDEPDVHSATTFALKDLIIAGRKLEFLHAYSAAEARRLMETTPGIAVVLLDVVMEKGDAGLQLVRAIRDELGCADTRIILRTGQPGYAPELEVIRDYDINDYKTKSELTRTRLVTSLTTAIRSYEQIRMALESAQAMDRLVRSAPSLLTQRSIGEFAGQALRLMAELLGGDAVDGVFCTRRLPPGDANGEASLYVAAALGAFAPFRGQDVAAIADAGLLDALERCALSGGRLHENNGIALCVGAGDGRALLYLRASQPLNEVVRRLADVLSVSIATGLENVTLFQQLDFFAYIDPLSGLPNRARFVSMIDDCLRRGEANRTVALIEVDHFSDINAALGHETGDELLKAVAKRLRAGFPAEVALARVSGGKYGLLGENATVDPERVLALFERPCVVDGQSLMIQPYIGLERLTEADGGGADVLKNATIALSRARSERRQHWQYFTREMQTTAQERLALLHDLRHATEAKRGLSLVYQPQVEIASGKVCGAEALLRWQNVRGENIPPDRFIPVAEYSHLIIELGEWVLRSACEQLGEWDRAGVSGLRMSVNVSLVQFRDPDFVGMARRCILDYGIDPGRIELEITESMALSEAETVVDTMNKMKSFGVSIAVDDFGSGYSSLGHLQRLPLNRLKIDRVFVQDLTAGSSGATIADTIVKLGHMLGLAVIAEGVETGEQLDALRRMGCQEVQGFYFSPPVAAADFPALVGKRL